LAFVEMTDPAYPKARERAQTWLKTNQTGQGNEPAALRLLLAVRFGDAGQVKERLKELLDRQNADGSWSWGKEYPGDGYATGQSLYALAEAGLTAADPAVQRAWKFLLAKQEKDGSFFTPSKKPNMKSNPIATYWGTAWATIGLLHTLPPARP
jgi:squalene-hopene/tetraprenyl-beta-curcumene cyclase